MKQANKQPGSLMPYFLVPIFIGLAIFSFKPEFSNHDVHKIGKYYVNLPDSLPAYDGLYWVYKRYLMIVQVNLIL